MGSSIPHSLQFKDSLQARLVTDSADCITADG